MIKKIEGIVISEIDYKESSKIINILTEEGIIGIVAKGTKKVKNKLSGVTSKLTYGYFHMNYKENGLSTLIEVDIIDNFKNIRKDINKMSYSLYLLELAYRVYKHENNSLIYSMLISSLKKIDFGFLLPDKSRFVDVFQILKNAPKLYRTALPAASTCRGRRLGDPRDLMLFI